LARRLALGQGWQTRAQVCGCIADFAPLQKPVLSRMRGGWTHDWDSRALMAQSFLPVLLLSAVATAEQRVELVYSVEPPSAIAATVKNVAGRLALWGVRRRQGT